MCKDARENFLSFLDFILSKCLCKFLFSPWKTLNGGKKEASERDEKCWKYFHTSIHCLFGCSRRYVLLLEEGSKNKIYDLSFRHCDSNSYKKNVSGARSDYVCWELATEKLHMRFPRSHSRRISFRSLASHDFSSWFFHHLSFLHANTILYIAARGKRRRHRNIWSGSVKIFELIININGRFRIQDQKWTTGRGLVRFTMSLEVATGSILNSFHVVKIIEPFVRAGIEVQRKNCAHILIHIVWYYGTSSWPSDVTVRQYKKVIFMLVNNSPT